MKIGKQDAPFQSICTSNAETIIVRGHDLVEDLIGSISFTEHMWLLVTGSMPSDVQRRVLDATLVAIAEHGMVPSVQAARMTLAAAPEALQGAVAAGLLGCGSVILGASESAGMLLQEIVEEEATSQAGINAAAATVVRRYRADRRAIPGFGHPLHKGRDPRAEKLIAIGEKLGTAGRYAQAVEAVERCVAEIVGKPLMMNVSGAIPCVLLDAGFPLKALKGVPLLARTASLVAHLMEEQTRSVGFILSRGAAEVIAYDGLAPAGFVADEN
jgi:citrate synthase